MKLKLFLSICLVSLTTAWGQSTKEAQGVIERFAGKKMSVDLSLSLNKQNGYDVFETSVSKGKLKVKASSGVALCRGFYDYVKSQNAGICSWSGNRLELPRKLAAAPAIRVVSPFKNHYYFNVVTYGYTMPYWDWERWEKEIDWMALHGVDMPLALVANEAISARVWKKMGLTDEEIDNYFVGPAHFPWMRMGNISGIDGPLPQSWHAEQVELQHKILNRMKSLGMSPICPAFAGFVPQAMSRLYPNIKIIETSWCGEAFHNWMLSPDEELFGKIGQMFIEEWDKEFGKSGHYIADSFNEMEIPFPPKGSQERYELLAKYGDEVYSSIKAGNPDAVWVMQGWMFGYQRDIWDYKTLEALVSKVPDDKMLLLDLAEDYNHVFWKNGANWDFYKGFYNKEWVYSVIPNMGGKSGLTGDMEFYANGRLKALRSSNKGRLSGYGMAPEGIENNEVLYELISDGGWTAQEIDVDKWLKDYSLCRYGKVTPQIISFWEDMRKSVYGSFTDHPRYNWQFRPGRVNKGSINANDAFYAGVESLAQTATAFRNSPLFIADMVEMTAHYLGGKMEILLQAINRCYLEGQTEDADAMEAQFIELAQGMDRILASHPTLRLDRWLNDSRKHGDNAKLKDYYERNARRIVTIWGPPVDDYSARIWSGLIRDYYIPRWKHYFQTRKTGKPFDYAKWEIDWVENKTGLSASQPYENVIEASLRLIEQARGITKNLLDFGTEEELGIWSPSDVSTIWKDVSWNIPVSKLPSLKGVRFQYAKGKNSMMIKEVVLETDGVEVCRDAHTGEAGETNTNNVYQLSIPHGSTGNNTCTLRAKVKSEGGNDSYGKILLISQ